MMSVDFQWVNDAAELARLCQQFAQQTAIALDTEFIRTRTYYPNLGLLQIADAYGTYLIDPLAIDDCQPLIDILINPHIVKVVHACSEDLEVFQHAFGVLPVALFDTQIAAAFAGYGASIGYANLLRTIKAIDIPKHETRSDWLQRPLSDAQLHYAALDVEHLLSLYATLTDELVQLGRLEWAQSDSIAMVDKLRETNHSENYFLRIKSAWKLQTHQLAVLKVLCRWREEFAREKNIPRGHVVKDTSLFDMALRLPKNIKQLQRIQDISTSFVHERGELVLSLIVDALDNNMAYPNVLPKPLNIDQSALLKLLKVKVKDIADKLSIPQELLVRKKDYEFLLRSCAVECCLPSSLLGWRKGVIGDDLLDYLQVLHNKA